MKRSKRGLIAKGLAAALSAALAWTPFAPALAGEAGAPAAVAALPELEQVRFIDAKREERDLEGRVLVEAQDGGLLVQGRDGRLWTVEKERLLGREPAEGPFVPLSPDEFARQLVAELGPGTEIVTTRHYVIATRAGKPYAQWCGTLFERLFVAFQNYWKQRGIKLHEPEFPLAAIVFPDSRQFAEFAYRDIGPEVAGAKGYYSLLTNRMVMYDLTAGTGGRAGTFGDVNRSLASVPFNVATVVHEATHQIAFNSGLHTRLADNPLWLVEGMAMFFETPDLTSRSGWKTVGAVNEPRLRQFLEGARRGRDRNALESLVASDGRFTNQQTMSEAYAEAWALSYFLIRTRRAAYVDYLRRMSEKPQLIYDGAERRLEEFRAAFGEDLQRLDAELVKYMGRVK